MEDRQSNYYDRVIEIVLHIPEGRVTTYGAIAAFLGITSGARMVGYALNNTEDQIPAHRVVNRLGQLTGRGHFPDDSMRERLLQEGVTFIDDYTVDLEAYFWDPKDSGLEIYP